MKKRAIGKQILLLIFSVAVLLPIVFMVSNSFMGEEEAMRRYTEFVTPENQKNEFEGNQKNNIDGNHYAQLTFVPNDITVSSYQKLMTENQSYLRMFWNSVLITLPILIFQLMISPMAAYAFELTSWKWKEVMYLMYIIVMLMPMQFLMVPHYITAEIFGYNNTWWAIILPAMFAPFGTFLIRQQLGAMDKTLIEAARIEGATEWQIFNKIVLPMIRPTMAALATLVFVDCWNIVDQAVVFIKNVYNEPLSVYLAKMITENPVHIFASATLFMIPAILVFMFHHDAFIHGISLSGGRKS